MRPALLPAAALAAVMAAAGCKKAAAPSAPADAAQAGGPTATIFNGAGAEVKDVVATCLDVAFSSGTAVLPAGRSAKLALPKGCARLSVSFARADQKSEKTVDLRGDATFILAADGSIGASLQP